MKSLCVLLLLLSTPVSALPLGNPSEPLFSSRFRIGYYGDYVNHIAMNEGINNRMSTSGLQLTMNCFNRLDLFCIASLSAMRLTPDTLLSAHSNEAYANQFFYMDSNSSSSFSAGARGVLYSYKNFTLGMEGQFFQMNPKARMNSQTMPKKEGNWGEWNVRYTAWQIGNAISYKIGKLASPYAGLKWQWARYDFSEVPPADSISPGFTFADLENVHHLSCTVGLAFTDQQQWSFSVETSMISEKSLGLTAQYRF